MVDGALRFLKGKKIHCLLNSALFRLLGTSQDGAWFAAGNMSGHQKLRWLRLFIDYMIVFMHQAQYPIGRRLHVYAGQANSDPGLDFSLLGH